MRNFIFLFLSVSTLPGCAALGLGWPENVYNVEIGGVYGHDLSEGEVIDLTWASDSSTACWVETENQNFSGSHVFFGLTQPADSYLTVAVTPEAGLDVSMYLMQMTTDLHLVPPSLSSYPNSCNVGFDPIHDANPGESEFVEVLGYPTDTNVLIGIAGTDDLTAGAFELEIYAEMP